MRTRDQSAWVWFGCAVAAMPITVLLHELGHLAAAYAVGYNHPRLSGMVASYGTDGHPPSHRILVAAAGPAATLALTVGGFLFARKSAGPVAVATMIGAPFRGLLWILVGLVVASGYGESSGGDEATLARLLGVPLRFLAGASSVLFIFAFIATVVFLRRAPRGKRWRPVIGLGLGIPAGWILCLLFQATS